MRDRALRLPLILLMLSACSPHAVVQSTPADPHIIQVADGSIRVNIAATPADVSEAELHVWVRTAARAVLGYYRRFPGQHLELTVVVDRGGHDISGQTYGAGRIDVELGRDVTTYDLGDDWVLTHEMFHLAFPDLRQSHLWMNEGLSTYLEPIARARIGNLPVEDVWKQMVEGFPDGEPAPGDQGLDRTHTWGRTYWGGCMFWLLADIRIRQQTGNQKSLGDALRAILDAGGDGSASWPVNRVIETADRATGTNVLRTLYDEMALEPQPVDLKKLWADLGVHYQSGRISFDDAAPLAEIRRSITG
jgi:hypothetical protein